MAKLIGLTGNIGSGKSLAAQILKSLGAAVIDADILARAVVEPGQKAYADLVAAFGPQILQDDGKLDRARLGQLVFADDMARARLNAITHPRINEAALAAIAAYREQGYPLIIYEAALLLSRSDYQQMFDEVWLIAADAQQIHQRLRLRDGLDDQAIAKRLQAQMSLEQQIPLVTRVIYNDGDIESLRGQLEQLYQELIIDNK